MSSVFRCPSTSTILALFLFHGVGGCQSPDSAQVATTRSWDSAGVTIVESHKPAWESGGGWRIGDLLTSIGIREGPSEYLLFVASDATRLSDGGIVVANSGTSELRFYGPDGRFLTSVGRTGGGPGEFSREHTIRAVARLPGDTLVTWDIYGQRMSLFSPDGAFSRSVRLPASGRLYFWKGLFKSGVPLLSLKDPEGRGSLRGGVSLKSRTLGSVPTADGCAGRSTGVPRGAVLHKARGEGNLAEPTALRAEDHGYCHWR